MNIKIISREEKLINNLNSFKMNLPGDISLYVSGQVKVDRAFILARLSGFHANLALEEGFLKGNDEQFRQNFYLAHLISDEANKKGFNPGFRDLGFPIKYFAFALLSDSSDCVKAISEVELFNKDDYKGYHFYCHLLQLLLKDDFEAIQGFLESGKKRCSGDFRNQLIEGKDFFTLIINRDVAGLEAHIEALAHKKTSVLIDGEFLNPWASVCAKICWIKGIEVQVDHPLVPMDLMPVRPLDHYEIEYEFLKPGWEPPKQSFMDRVKRMVKR
ncbi:hypothetical protein [Amphibiibacter pelophylacis]|uniref:Uncharacterized protein n=1 Tax=Amphibiibacter pelophylacis TaxID=1799477 RepID=A0ACC6P436_9BURK